MRFLFDSFEVNVAQRNLSREGRQVPTEPKVFDVLLYLIENRERAVSREELFESCWEGVFVSDGTLSRCLSRIRQALGQERNEKTPIQTLHSKGYRFVADVKVIGAEDADRAGEAEPTDSAAHDLGAPLSLDRRFVSMLHVSFRAFAEDAEAEAELVLTCIQKIHDIAAAHRCKVFRMPGRAVTIQIGYPNTEEGPSRVALEIAHLTGRLVRHYEIGIQVTMASGVASIHTPVAEDQDGVLVGVDPILVVTSLEAGSFVLYLDDRSMTTLRDLVEAKQTKCLGADGGEITLNRVTRAAQPANASLASDGIFVGRDRELLRLHQQWEKVRRGKGHAAVISGGPGMGKTGLIEAFLLATDIPADSVFRMTCSPHHTNTPFYPQLILLRDVLGIEDETPPIRQLRVIEQFLEQFDRPPTDHLPVLASLMSLEQPRRSSSELQLDAERRWHRTMDAMLSMIVESARNGPAILWIDNAQWADPSTISMLARLTAILDEHSLMIVACTRDVQMPHHAGFSDADHLTLEPLHRLHSMKLLSEMSHRGVLPSGLIGTISERSGGVPLYLREIVRMAQSSADDAPACLDANTIPDTLQGLLASRLETTRAALPLAQWVAMVGGAAPHALLERLAGLDPATLDSRLDHLVRAGILRIEAWDGDAAYDFDEGLMRDAAYASMANTTRRERHLAIAEALCVQFPDLIRNEPERIAHHFAASSKPGRAAPYWQAAGVASLEKSGVKEAKALFANALESARQMPYEQSRRLAAEIESILAVF